LALGGSSGQKYLGRTIAYKWSQKNSGGWFLGLLKRQLFDESEEFNFEVDFDDNTTVEVQLEMNTYCKPEDCVNNQGPDAWMLLDDLPLGQEVASMAAAGTLHNPPRPPGKGRKQSKRKQPSHGPTNAAYKAARNK
jgi:hypothetical protein